MSLVPWGANDLDLALSTGRFRFRGLTSSQAEMLAARYAPYHNPRGFPEQFFCSVYRLPKPLESDPKHFTHNGQYALHIRQQGPGVEIRGFDFVGNVEWGAPASGHLGVYAEAELAYPNVIENFMRVVSAQQIVRHGGLLLHSAGIVLEGRAHIFAGRSGTGKSTLARKAQAAGVKVLSDDINVLLADARGVYRAYPVPFAGELGASVDALDPDGYPIAAVHSLRQGAQAQWRPLPFSAGVARLVAAAPFVNADIGSVGDLLAGAQRIAASVPIGDLTVGRDTPFGIVHALIGGSPRAGNS